MLKKFVCIPALLFLLSSQAFSHEVYLTGAEFERLLSIITRSRENSEAQMKLIAELRQALQTQETALKTALSSLDISEAELTELKTTLEKIQSYSRKFAEYCGTLEGENKTLKTRNKIFGAGCGALGAGFIIVLLVLIL